jgi:Peptidase inhibitor I78 family
MIRASLFAFALLAAACTPPAETPPEQPVAEEPTALPQTAAEATAQDTCGAAEYRGLVGQNFAAVTLPAGNNIRIIQPDTMVTQDFNPTRINMIVGADGIITAFECY